MFKQICDTISHAQCYECQEILYNFCVDKCLLDEIKWLNDQGIQTIGSCCGKHINIPKDNICHKGSIIVSSKYIDKMIDLGYDYYINDFGVHCFISKTHII